MCEIFAWWTWSSLVLDLGRGHFDHYVCQKGQSIKCLIHPSLLILKQHFQAMVVKTDASVFIKVWTSPGTNIAT